MLTPTETKITNESSIKILIEDIKQNNIPEVLPDYDIPDPVPRFDSNVNVPDVSNVYTPDDKTCHDPNVNVPDSSSNVNITKICYDPNVNVPDRSSNIIDTSSNINIPDKSFNVNAIDMDMRNAYTPNDNVLYDSSANVPDMKNVAVRVNKYMDKSSYNSEIDNIISMMNNMINL